MRPAGVLTGTLLVAAAGLALVPSWPGVMTWDGARAYGMALGGPIDDWHPPVMIVLWRLLLGLAPGPAPMLVAQTALYVTGWGMLARWAWRLGRPWLAVALAAAALFPVALVLMGVVLKDCLMAGALLVALGLLAPEQPGCVARTGAIALLLFAATLRFNAFGACLPLLVAALPSGWRTTRRRMVGASIGATLLLLAATPLANRLIGARPSGVELSQVLFDLGGITRFSGTDAFPPVPGVRDPVSVNAGCYRPELWDAYAWWTDTPCSIGWTSVGGALQRAGAIRWWLGQIAHHPLAYAEHRLRHFAANTRMVALDGPDTIVPPRPAPNPYGFEPASDRVRDLLHAGADRMARTPLGWPFCWLALAAALLLVASRRPPAAPSCLRRRLGIAVRAELPRDERRVRPALSPVDDDRDAGGDAGRCGGPATPQARR